MLLLAGRVWLYPHDPDGAKVKPSVAVITSEQESVLVDAGQSPTHAREIQTAIAAAGLPPVRRLVYTHHHWDHVWGACAWPDVEIIGHSAGARFLERDAALPWSHRYLTDGVAANPRLEPSYRARAAAMPSWDGFTILPPHTEFDARLTLPCGIEVHHVDSHHCPDATIVFDPVSGVALLGDSFYPPPFHLRQPDDGYDQPLIHRLLALDGIDFYVGAHADPMSRAELAALLG